MCRMYKIVFILFVCVHTAAFSMHLSWLFLRHKKKKQKEKPQVEYLPSIRYQYEKPIIKTTESYFELFSQKELATTIAQEVEKEKIFGNNFKPKKPLKALSELGVKLPKKITTLLELYGLEFEREFMFFFRRFKNVRGAWDLFIANVVEMEDRV